ncbi:hypothetical protein ABDD95_21050 [Mucilaginibacter sp. PAMB04274]|uniref:glycine-rich domain-containing protein n=1 Tax=Mucilaginibacter sp. PAMB04274 TaxID=3138568 RepID=UPI0031F69537
MTASESALWDKIKRFELDDNQSSFKFSDRLARENGWDQNYTIRVIEEYKKFIFLCCVSSGSITPSDAVDQAWHLHLTYTKSYWVDFCKNTLNQEIHHNPTQGGSHETKKFNGYYTQSFKVYTEKFKTEPPADIWLDNAARFSDIDFQRVNLNTYVLVKRSNIKNAGFWIIVIPIFILLVIFVDFEPALFLPLVAVTVIAYAIYNSNGLKQHGEKDISGCGGDNSGGCDSSHTHGGHDGHSGGDSGCGSGCSGCSGSGCSGCGGGD